MEVHARIVSACLQTLGLKSMHETPASTILPDGLQHAMQMLKESFCIKLQHKWLTHIFCRKRILNVKGANTRRNPTVLAERYDTRGKIQVQVP